VMLRVKGLARSLLVTDATAAAAAPPGLYPLAGTTVERAVDGSVRVPGAPMLAGSALCLDQAMRNLLAWRLADAPAAFALASENPTCLLAPALAAHGARLPPGAATWTAELELVSVRVGDLEIGPNYPAA